MRKMLSDEVVTIRPFKLSDAGEHLAHEDKKQVRWLSGGKGTLKGVKSWIEKNREFWEQNGPVYNFAVWLNEENKLIGMVEANRDNELVEGLDEGEVNVSYLIYSKYRKRGYAKKAVNLLLEFLSRKGFEMAVIRTDPENLASKKLAKSCGFKKEGEIWVDEEVLVKWVKNLL